MGTGWGKADWAVHVLSSVAPDAEGSWPGGGEQAGTGVGTGWGKAVWALPVLTSVASEAERSRPGVRALPDVPLYLQW